MTKEIKIVLDDKEYNKLKKIKDKFGYTWKKLLELGGYSLKFK